MRRAIPVTNVGGQPASSAARSSLRIATAKRPSRTRTSTATARLTRIRAIITHRHPCCGAHATIGAELTDLVTRPGLGAETNPKKSVLFMPRANSARRRHPMHRRCTHGAASMQSASRPGSTSHRRRRALARHVATGHALCHAQPAPHALCSLSGTISPCTSSTDCSRRRSRPATAPLPGKMTASDTGKRAQKPVLRQIRSPALPSPYQQPTLSTGV